MEISAAVIGFSEEEPRLGGKGKPSPSHCKTNMGLRQEKMAFWLKVLALGGWSTPLLSENKRWGWTFGVAFKTPHRIVIPHSTVLAGGPAQLLIPASTLNTLGDRCGGLELGSLPTHWGCPD